MVGGSLVAMVAFSVGVLSADMVGDVDDYVVDRSYALEVRRQQLGHNELR